MSVSIYGNEHITVLNENYSSISSKQLVKSLAMTKIWSNVGYHSPKDCAVMLIYSISILSFL